MGKAAVRAKAYADKHGLPTREVRVHDRAGQPVNRLFVPVLTHTQPDFLAKFSTKENTVIWRHNERDHVHAHIMLGETDHIGFTKAPHANLSDRLGANIPGKYVTMELSPHEISHMVNAL